MFLLILKQDESLSDIQYTFTFHNVSINTMQSVITGIGSTPLHSIMFLLIRKKEYQLIALKKLYIP